MAKSTRYISRARKDEGVKLDFSDMSVIIPAAGMGNRMKSYGPKCMINVNGIPLLERQIRHINKCYPNSDIIVVLGFQAEAVQARIKNKYKVRIVHNTDYQETNVAKSLFLGIQASTSDRCLIVYGDLIFNANAIKDLYGKESKIVVGKSGVMGEEEVGVVCSGGKVTNFSYTLEEKWCQIAFLSGKELKMFEMIAGREESERWFGYEIFNQMIDRGASLVPHWPKNIRIFEIDSPKDIKKVKSAGVIIT